MFFDSWRFSFSFPVSFLSTGFTHGLESVRLFEGAELSMLHMFL